MFEVLGYKPGNYAITPAILEITWIVTSRAGHELVLWCSCVEGQPETVHTSSTTHFCCVFMFLFFLFFVEWMGVWGGCRAILMHSLPALRI